MSSKGPVLSDSDESVIRIKAGRVAQLMDMIGELSLAADEVLHHPQLRELELDELQNSAHKLHQLIRELQDLASGLRLVPIDSVFRRMQRLARDLSKQTQKQFKFELSGEDTEIDKVVVDTLSDPLVHIIRNSVDHGLESAEDRAKTDKDPMGKVRLSAKQEAGDIYITIEDDGGGLNKQLILNRAIEKGLVKKNQHLSDQQVWQLIFEPGFSTKESVSQLSGRGVGMDVVKTTIAYLRGRINILSQEGQGTKIQLIIPLSVAFLNTMVVANGDALFAVAIDNVIEVFQATPEDISAASANQYHGIRLRDQLVPIKSLDEIHGKNTTLSMDQPGIFIILHTLTGPLAIPVDRILGQYQVTIKPLTGYLKDIRAISGCALLPSGDVAWVLDTTKISATAPPNNSNDTETEAAECSKSKTPIQAA